MVAVDPKSSTDIYVAAVTQVAQGYRRARLRTQATARQATAYHTDEAIRRVVRHAHRALEAGPVAGPHVSKRNAIECIWCRERKNTRVGMHCTSYIRHKRARAQDR